MSALRSFRCKRQSYSFANAARLLDEMDRPQPGHQDQTGDINCAEENDRPDFAHRSEEQCFAENVADPSARTLNVESQPPASKVTRLQLKQTCAGRDEENNPRQSRDQAQVRVE